MSTYQVMTREGDLGSAYEASDLARAHAIAAHRWGFPDVGIMEVDAQGLRTWFTNPQEPAHIRFKTVRELLAAR